MFSSFCWGDHHLLLRWCAAWPADWRWWEASTHLLSLTQKLSLMRLQIFAHYLCRRRWTIWKIRLIDFFKTIPIHLIEKHLKSFLLRFGRRRRRNGFREIGSSNLLPPDLRHDHNCFQVGSSLIFQASCLAVWQGQVYSVQVSFSFHKNSCELSLISFQSGQLVGEVLGSEEQIGPANQVDSCTSTTDGEIFPKISTISSFWLADT